MIRSALISGIAVVAFACSAHAAVNCRPTSTNPTRAELLKSIICLEDALNTPVPQPTPTDPNAVHFGDVVDLRFGDVSWCIARGDPGDNKAYTVPCSAGAPGSGQTQITIDKHQ